MHPPAYIPAWAIELAVAGDSGLIRVTAKCITPGQDQPRPNPSRVPATNATGEATDNSASPAEPRPSIHTATISCRLSRRSASQPPVSRPNTQITLPAARVNPARAGDIP